MNVEDRERLSDHLFHKCSNISLQDVISIFMHENIKMGFTNVKSCKCMRKLHFVTLYTHVKLIVMFVWMRHFRMSK